MVAHFFMDEVWFGGETYEAERDRDRLARQLSRVKTAIADGQWKTLQKLQQETGAPQASISARLRDLRKPRFGGHTIERRYISNGLFEYRLNDDVIG